MQTGEKHGRLTAISFVEFRGKKKDRPFWLFKCDCGKEHTTNVHSVKGGYTRSCGCYRREILLARTPFVKGEKHPAYIDGNCDTAKSKFYRAYRGMLQRCNNKNCSSYKHYGARGIKTYWNTYQDFKRDMIASYNVHVKKFGERDTTLERIDVNGNYSKENCRWATLKEQARNRRNTRYLEVGGEKMKAVEYAESLGFYRKGFLQRLDNGWDDRDFADGKKHLNTGNMRKNEKNYKDEKKRLMDIFKRSAQVVSTYLSVLDTRERVIIENRLGLKDGKRMTLDEIGKEQGCTRERVRQIEARAMEKMMKFYYELSR